MAIRKETIEVQGTVMYCDECGKKGPEAAYENPDEVIDAAQRGGWTQDERDRDLCPACSTPTKKRGK